MADINVTTYAQLISNSTNHSNNIYIQNDIHIIDEYPDGWSGTPTIRSAVIDGGGYTLYVPANTKNYIFAFGESGTWARTDSADYRTRIQNLNIVIEADPDLTRTLIYDGNWGYVTFYNCNFYGVIAGTLATAGYNWGQFAGFIFDTCTFDMVLYNNTQFLRHNQSYMYNEKDTRLEIRNCNINLNSVSTVGPATRDKAKVLIGDTTYVSNTTITGNIDLGWYYSNEYVSGNDPTGNKNYTALISFSAKGYNNIQGSNFTIDANLTNSSGVKLPIKCFNPKDNSPSAYLNYEKIDSETLSGGPGYVWVENGNDPILKDLNTWYKNSLYAAFTKFENVFENDINTLTFIGGNEHERLIMPVRILTGSPSFIFNLKFCTPSGYTKLQNKNAVIAVMKDNPDRAGDIDNLSVLGKMEIPNTPSSKFKEYSVIINTPSTSTVYLVIDFGHITDNEEVTLMFTDISYDNIYEWYIVDGRPLSIYYNEESPEWAVEEPYPGSLWRMTNKQYPITEFYNESAPSYAVEEPYPDSLWRIDPIYGLMNNFLNEEYLDIIAQWYIMDGRPWNPLFNMDAPEWAVEEPYPDSLWRITEDDELFNLLLHHPIEIVDPIPPDDPEVYEDTNISNYDNIINKPTINGTEITENITFDDLGIREMTFDMVNEMILESFGILYY